MVLLDCLEQLDQLVSPEVRDNKASKVYAEALVLQDQWVQLALKVKMDQ